MSIRVDSWLKPFSSTALGFREKLSPCFEPIRIRVARERKPPPAFGNEIGARSDFFVGQFHRDCSCLGWHRDFGLWRSRGFFASASSAFSSCRCPARCRSLLYFHVGRRSAGFGRSAANFSLDNFGFFRHRLIGVDDFISFTVHPTIRKQFLARVWSNQKSA